MMGRRDSQRQLAHEPQPAIHEATSLSKAVSMDAEENPQVDESPDLEMGAGDLSDISLDEEEVLGDLSDLGPWTKGEFTWSTSQLDRVSKATDNLDNLQDLLDLEDAGEVVTWPRGPTSNIARGMIAEGHLPPKAVDPVQGNSSSSVQPPTPSTPEEAMPAAARKWCLSERGISVPEERVVQPVQAHSNVLEHARPIPRLAQQSARGSTLRGRFAFGRVSAEGARLQTERDSKQ